MESLIVAPHNSRRNFLAWNLLAWSQPRMTSSSSAPLSPAFAQCCFPLQRSYTVWTTHVFSYKTFLGKAVRLYTILAHSTWSVSLLLHCTAVQLSFVICLGRFIGENLDKTFITFFSMGYILLRRNLQLPAWILTANSWETWLIEGSQFWVYGISLCAFVLMLASCLYPQTLWEYLASVG